MDHNASMASPALQYAQTPTAENQASFAKWGFSTNNSVVFFTRVAVKSGGLKSKQSSTITQT